MSEDIPWLHRTLVCHGYLDLCVFQLAVNIMLQSMHIHTCNHFHGNPASHLLITGNQREVRGQ